jgi:hypothetical protein
MRAGSLRHDYGSRSIQSSASSCNGGGSNGPLLDAKNVGEAE